MKHNEAVKILEEVSNYKANMVTDNSNSKWNRLETHWADDGYYTEWGHIFGGTDNEEESREELIIYIKPLFYPSIDEEDSYGDLTEWYEELGYIEEGDITIEDITKIHNGTFGFDDYEIIAEYRDYSSMVTEHDWIMNANQLISHIQTFVNETEEYHIEYTRGN